MNDASAMRTKIVSVFGWLASRALQEKFIVHGTADKYILPEELLEDVESLLLFSRMNEDAFEWLSYNEKAVVMQALREISETADMLPLDDGSLSNQYLVESSPEWDHIRTCARGGLTH